MQRDWALQPGGVDLSEAAQDRGVFNGEPGAKWSLAGMAERVLGARLAKLPELRLSDWEARPLSRAQATYAALDAFACLRIHEALQQLPVLAAVLSARAAAATAAEAARADSRQHKWPGNVAVADAAAVLVPAVPTPLRLQPAKQAVYSAVHEQGLPIAAIAALKRIQPSTVEMYLAEAVLNGHAYRWHSFGISDVALAAVEEAAAAVLCTAPASTSVAAAPARPQAQSVPLAPGSAAAAAASEAAAAAPATALPAASAFPAAAELHAKPCASWATGVFAHEDSSSHGGAATIASLDADAEAVHEQPAAAECSHHSGSPTVHTAGPAPSMAVVLARTHAAVPAAAHAQAAGGFIPVDLAARMSAAGTTLRTFREQLAVDVDFGQVRLALAHLGRTALRFAAVMQAEIQQRV